MHLLGKQRLFNTITFFFYINFMRQNADVYREKRLANANDSNLSLVFYFELTSEKNKKNKRELFSFGFNSV